MGTVVSQITSLTIVKVSTVYSDADQRKHQSTASLAFVRGVHRGPANSLHKCPVTRKMCSFDDIVMIIATTKQSTKSPREYVMENNTQNVYNLRNGISNMFLLTPF